MRRTGAEQPVVVMNPPVNGSGAKGLCHPSFVFVGSTAKGGANGQNKAVTESPKDVEVKSRSQRVKANKGAAGIDDESLEAFESRPEKKQSLQGLESNVLWQLTSLRLSKRWRYPKKSGGKRTLGVPTVADRVAQMVAKIYFEHKGGNQYSHPDSYGYRPGKISPWTALCSNTPSAAGNTTGYWNLTSKGPLFDNIDHELL